MHAALDDVPPENVIWMPAHLKPGTCGTAVRGDGILVEEVDVEANGEADRLAKRAVAAHRVPTAIRGEVRQHSELVADNAMWIARATAVANNHQGDPNRDTEASKTRAAQAAAEVPSTIYATPQFGYGLTRTQPGTSRSGSSREWPTLP